MGTMLAMQDEEIIALVSVTLTFVLMIVWISIRAGLRSQRLKVIEKAIESGRLDEATRSQLLQALGHDAGSRRTRAQWLPWLARNLVFIGGWITMLTGLGVWIASVSFGWGPGDAEGGMIAAFVGFAIITLPLALREVARRGPVSERR